MTTPSLESAMATIRTTAQRMQGDRRFKAVFEEYPAVEDADIEAWQDWLREQPDMQEYEVPQVLRELYGATGGFRWRWQYLPAKTPTTGSAEIVDLMSLYHRDDEDEKPVASIFDEPRAFDIIDQQELVAIRFARDSGSPLSLVRIDRSAATERALSLQPVEYVKRVADFAARYDWQRLFEAGKPAATSEAEALRREVAALLQGKKE